jgi:hypothetical protein
MKKLFALALLALAAVSAQAQTNTNTSPQSFFGTAFDYVTKFNTNLTTFGTNSPYELWMGAAYQSGLNIGAQVGLEAKPFSGVPGLTLGSVTTMAGIGGTFAEQEADLGYSIVHYDTEFGVGLGGVYGFQENTFQGAIYAEIKKAMTQNTFAGTRIEGVFGSGKPSQPIVSVFAGFTF